MAKYTIHQAKTNFSKLLVKASRGEEVIIMNRDTPVAKVIPFHSTKKRNWGFLAGKITIADDFDKTPSDFADYIK